MSVGNPQLRVVKRCALVLDASISERLQESDERLHVARTQAAGLKVNVHVGKIRIKEVATASVKRDDIRRALFSAVVKRGRSEFNITKSGSLERAVDAGSFAGGHDQVGRVEVDAVGSQLRDREWSAGDAIPAGLAGVIGCGAHADVVETGVAHIGSTIGGEDSLYDALARDAGDSGISELGSPPLSPPPLA